MEKVTGIMAVTALTSSLADLVLLSMGVHLPLLTVVALVSVVGTLVFLIKSLRTERGA